jgi:branched-subunit amino acid ABC-type transport system permease component
MNVLQAVERAAAMAATMGWEILWPLMLGFTLSGVVQAVGGTAMLRMMNAPGDHHHHHGGAHHRH